MASQFLTSPPLQPYLFIDRNSAYFYCSQYGAYLYDVINAFQNTDVQNRAIKYDYLWLGLTCLSNSTSSCVWDSGMALTRTSYTNFDTTGINITAGACVRMDVKTGLWYSADCSNGQAYYGCKYTPSVTSSLLSRGYGHPIYSWSLGGPLNSLPVIPSLHFQSPVAFPPVQRRPPSEGSATSP